MAKKLTTQIFIDRVKKIHTNIYDYSLVNYINAYTKVKIICKLHGIFEQIPNSHMRGIGCAQCGGLSVRKLMGKSTRTFIQEASIIHNSKYDYSNAIYKNAKNKLKIICPSHGEFNQGAGSHLEGHGCPSCHSGGFNQNIPGILYYLKDMKTGYYKIGITNRNIKERFGNMKRIFIIKTWHFNNGSDASELEHFLLSEFKENRVLNESWVLNKGGKTEFFNNDILNLDGLK